MIDPHFDTLFINLIIPQSNLLKLAVIEFWKLFLIKEYIVLVQSSDSLDFAILLV